MTDLVSIIMPAYNAEKTIEESIDSVLNQEYQNWELLIVDDCSKDNTAKIVKEYASVEARIKYIKQEKNGGVAAARNKAIELAAGSYIAYLDSDDIWYPEKLNKQIEFMRNNELHMSCTSYEVIDEYSNELNKIVNVPVNISKQTLLKGSKIGCLTVMMDMSRVSKEDLIMKDIGHEDYVTWLNVIGKYGTIGCLPDNLAKYRIFSDSLSGNKKRAAKWQFKVYREEMNLGLVKSVYYMTHYAINALTKYSRKEQI